MRNANSGSAMVQKANGPPGNLPIDPVSHCFRRMTLWHLPQAKYYDCMPSKSALRFLLAYRNLLECEGSRVPMLLINNMIGGIMFSILLFSNQLALYGFPNRTLYQR